MRSKTRVLEVDVIEKNTSEKQRRAPRQMRSRFTYDAILLAAAQVLEEQGDTHFTTNRVADRAGVSIGSLYQYFENKEQILVALAEKEERALPSKTALQEMASDSSESPLRLGLRAYLNMLPNTPTARAKALETVLRTRGAQGVADATEARFENSGLFDGLADADRFVLSRAITGVVQAAVREGRADLQSREFEDALVRLARGCLATCRA